MCYSQWQRDHKESCPVMLFSEALEIRPGLTAVMGSGGKTSLVCRLADELSAARVIIATSTHMR
ncbi:MAG: hypothetical protein ACLVGX_01595, partial [Oscillospiraceae bacterium]